MEMTKKRKAPLQGGRNPKKRVGGDAAKHDIQKKQQVIFFSPTVGIFLFDSKLAEFRAWEDCWACRQRKD